LTPGAGSWYDIAPATLTIDDRRRNEMMKPMQVGQSVFYRDVRYYVETPGENFIRIADTQIRPDAPAPLTRNSFYVPVGLVEEAPTTRNRYGKQPTKKAIERREKMKSEGVRDNGDEVAKLLRECKDLDAVFKLAAKHLGETVAQLKQKYDHLDNGRKRMTLGNRLRGHFKKGGK
jgi:hypothetical protein